MRSQLHMTIDRIKCDGHGLCAELLPEMIRLDDWGYPIIAPGPISDRLGPHAQRAVAAASNSSSRSVPTGRFPGVGETSFVVDLVLSIAVPVKRKRRWVCHDGALS